MLHVERAVRIFIISASDGGTTPRACTNTTVIRIANTISAPQSRGASQTVLISSTLFAWLRVHVLVECSHTSAGCSREMDDLGRGKFLHSHRVRIGAVAYAKRAASILDLVDP